MYKPYDKLLDKITYISGLILLFSGIIALYFINKFNIDVTALPFPCTLYEMTGLYCPGCGGTRSLMFLLHGHLFKSLYYNPFVAYVFFPWIWFLITHTIHGVTGRFCNRRDGNISLYKRYPLKFMKPLTVRPLYIYIGIGLLFVQCIIKNIACIFGYAPY